MSSHIWDVRTPTADTVNLFVRAYCLARSEGPHQRVMKPFGLAEGTPMDFPSALRFGGYVCERSRQTSGYTPDNVWRAAHPRHQYARGRNVDNYLYAGAFLLLLAYWCCELHAWLYVPNGSTLYGLMVARKKGTDVGPQIVDALQDAGLDAFPLSPPKAVVDTVTELRQEVTEELFGEEVA